MKRIEIINLLASDVDPGTTCYRKMKECFNDCDNIDEIDEWFDGIVDSIVYYRPNKKLLVIEGKFKHSFFEEITPPELAYLRTYNLGSRRSLYESMVVECEFERALFRFSAGHQYDVILDENGQFAPVKRMSSFGTHVDKWQFPNRINTIVLKPKNINWPELQLISKIRLWTEIFHKNFKDHKK